MRHKSRPEGMLHGLCLDRRIVHRVGHYGSARLSHGYPGPVREGGMPAMSLVSSGVHIRRQSGNYGHGHCWPVVPLGKKLGLAHNLGSSPRGRVQWCVIPWEGRLLLWWQRICEVELLIS